MYKTFTTTGISILPSAFTLPALFAFIKLSTPDSILEYLAFASGLVANKLALISSDGQDFLEATLVKASSVVFSVDSVVVLQAANIPSASAPNKSFFIANFNF